jgi:hypothetical protein
MNSSRDALLVVGAAVLLGACSPNGGAVIETSGGTPGVGGGQPATSTGIGGASTGTGVRTGTGGTAAGGKSSGAGIGGGSSGGAGGANAGTTSKNSVGGTTSTVGGSTSTSGTGGSQATSSCAPGVPITSQIPRLLNSQYDNVIRDLLGVTVLAGANGAPPSSLLNTDSTGPMNSYMWQAYQDAAEMIASEVMAGSNRSHFITCDPTATNCLKNTITTFGRKAFRRPLTTAEVTRFQKLGQTTPAGTPEQVAETTLMAFLVSPSFLQLTELNTQKQGDYYQLSSYEVATRLSMMIWGSIPDDTLNTAANSNALQSKDQILTQAKRMFSNRDKAGPQVAQLHRHYIGLDDQAGHWFKVRPDPSLYPLYTPAADDAEKAEFDLFFEEVAYSGGSFADLFLSNVTYVNQNTAPLYGLDPTNFGAAMQRVELDKTQRPGFLTRLGFLSSHAHSDSTSPILRGAFVIKNIIGTDQELIPDPNALNTPPPQGTFTTERDYVDALTNGTACKGCHHVYVNPPGFVLEAFDAAGSWQTKDPLGGDINATADVIFGSDTKTISSPLQMMQEIATRDFTRRSYTEKIVAAATGRNPNDNDACLVDQLSLNLTTDGYSIIDLLADITQADSFRLRQRDPN